MPGFSEHFSKISQRWVTVVLLFIVFMNIYAMRTCLSITITKMTLPPNHTKIFLDDTCSQNYDTLSNVHSEHNEILNTNRYDWSERTQGFILSSFYGGFVIFNILGGMICQKFGSKNVISFSILCTSVLTLLIPHGTTWGGSTGLMILRLGIGCAEGLIQPALTTLLAHWIPADERAKAGYILYSSIPLGTVYGYLPSGIILKHFDWSVVFYFFGTIGLVSFSLHVPFCYNRPSESRFISDEELNYLKNTIKNTHLKLPLTPWRYILKSLPVWTLIIASTGQVYGLVIASNDMPKYMSSVLKFSVQKNGFLSSIPYLSMWITGSIFSYAADKLIAKEILSITAVRKIGCSIASIGFAVFLIAASYAGCNGILSVVLLSLSMACICGLFFSTLINSVDLSPNFASTIAGLMHGISGLVGFLAPYSIGLLTPNQTIKEWRLAFWIVFGIVVGSNTVYLIFGSGEVQEWNDPAFLNKEKTDNENTIKERIDLLHVSE